MRIFPYERNQAILYARRWVFGRNPDYYDFSKIGGDCTNFVSQCLYAGSNTMNFTPNGWYYNSSFDRSPSWTDVDAFKNFVLNNQNEGPFGTVSEMGDTEAGDFILLGTSDGDFYHSTIIVGFENGVPLIACHTYDQFNKPILSYNAERFLCIHVAGVRK